MKSNGLATILLMIPVLTVPALAIFGIPQFAPVVASPIEDGRNRDRELRGGNSTRHSQDELFDEIDGFSSETENNSEAVTSLRNRGTSKTPQREKTRRRADLSSASARDGDLENGSTWPNSPRRPSLKESDELVGREGTLESTNVNNAAIHKTQPRFQRHLSAVEKSNEEVRQARIDDPDQRVTQSGFSDEAEVREQSRNSNEEKRRGSGESLGSNRRDTRSEPLTWAAAVERLNEFDIRSFRLEPGGRSGQFVFICSYSSPDEPSVSYRFEAGADEPLKAVEKVIEQIVEWRRQR